jgi:molecular chaperone DnaJ
MKDYYKILGIEKTASQDEIKKAFYKLAHQHHPDKGGDPAKFKEANEAYQVLSDANKRAQYDKFGTTFDGAQGGFPGGQGGGFPGGFQWGWGNGGENAEGFDFGDLGSIVEEMFGFGGGAGRQRGAKDLRKGNDIEVDLEVNLEDVLAGREQEISLYKLNACVRCQGTGAEPGTKNRECFSCRGAGQVQQIRKTVFGSFTQYGTCPECGGEGYIPEKKCNVCKGEGRVKSEDKIKVFIPSGVDNNQVIKVAGRGEAGKKGGKAGDLYIKIFVKRHPVFERKGDDLFTNVSISISQASLGSEIEVSLLDKTNILLDVPAGTESGKVFKVSGKGIPKFSGYGKGNMYVTLIVKTPKKLTKHQKELLEELKKEGL